MALPAEFAPVEERTPAFIPSADRIEGLNAQRRRLSGKRVRFNVSYLDDVTFGILPTDLIVIGAETGAGKTTLGTMVALNAARDGKRVAYLALEAFTNEVEQRLKFHNLSRLAWDTGDQGRGTLTYAAWMSGLCEDTENRLGAEAEQLLAGQVGNLSTYYRESSFTVDDVVEKLLSLRGKADLVLFDHLHFVDLVGDDENRGMKNLCKTLGDMVNELEIPVVAIAHLRKKNNTSKSARLVPDLHEFHGASDITKIATKVVTLARAWDRPNADRSRVATYLRVEKDRLAGKSEYVAIQDFDLRSNTYAGTYRLGRLTEGGSEFEAVSPSGQPWWAKNSVCTGTGGVL